MPKILTDVLNWCLARIEEPSTWAGTGAAAAVIMQEFPHTGEAILGVMTAVGALLAIILPEHPHAK